jgi:hypothetical protein
VRTPYMRRTEKTRTFLRANSTEHRVTALLNAVERVLESDQSRFPNLCEAGIRAS